MKPKIGSPVKYKGGSKRGFIERLTPEGAFVTTEGDLSIRVPTEDLEVLAKGLEASTIPTWLPAAVPVLVEMAGKAPRPRVVAHTNETVTLRYVGRTATQTTDAYRRLYILARKYRLAVQFQMKVNGLYVLIGNEEVVTVNKG